MATENHPEGSRGPSDTAGPGVAYPLIPPSRRPWLGKGHCCVILTNFITALYGMQSRYSDGNSVCLSVCPSVCLSVKRVHCDKTEESYI